MGRDRQRVLGLLIAFVVLAAASIFAMDWFVLRASGSELGMALEIRLDLRSASMCADATGCVSVSLSYIRDSGFYPTFATATFWGTVVVALCVVYQAGTKIITGFAMPAISRIGILGGLATLAATVFTAYLFNPNVGSMERAMAQLSVERTWAPLALIVGHLVGVLALHYAVVETTGDDEPVVLPTASVPRRAAPSPTVPPAAETGDVAAAAPGALASTSIPLPVFPDHLRQQLRFVVVTAELSRGGVDARREDGSTVLTMWRNVVGVVARRLPPDHDGAAFVDLVSEPGATLRFLPWTRITGEPIATGDDRTRALIALVLERCPDLKLDPATRAFVDGTGAPAQLPDAATLAQHDEHLA